MSLSARQQGREVVALHGLADRIEVRQGNALALDFPNGTVNEIVKRIVMAVVAKKAT